MAEVKKARLFLRRGTDTDRKTTTLCEGELGYSTDAYFTVETPQYDGPLLLESSLKKDKNVLFFKSFLDFFFIF